MPFIAAKSLILVRNTPARTTSSKLLPAALRTAERFWRTRSVSATMPPSTTLPVAGSWATCPLKKRKPSILTAWENGPTGGASSGEVIAALFIANSSDLGLPGRIVEPELASARHLAQAHLIRPDITDLDRGPVQRRTRQCMPNLNCTRHRVSDKCRNST